MSLIKNSISLKLCCFILLTYFITEITQAQFPYDPQTGPVFSCGTGDSVSSDPYNGGPKTGYIHVVVAYFDFPNGRLPGNIIPVTIDQINELIAIDSRNLEAVSRFGYVRDQSTGRLMKTPQKYTYQNAWDREFSLGVYLGSNHPDNADYGDNKAYGYGSMRDWFREISYGNLDLIPGTTWPNRTGNLYQTGIVNDTFVYNNKVLIKPISLPKNKYDYSTEGVTFCNEVMGDAPGVLKRMHQHDSLDFDLDTYLQDNRNKIIYIVAGSNSNAVCDGLHQVVGYEKVGPNSDSSWTFLEGLMLDAHELGHAIGWGHTNAGTYCIMQPNGAAKNDCPQHPNIVFKLQAGWIDQSHIRLINYNQNVTDLPPSEYYGDCAIVTTYGKAGFNNSFGHSEYTVFENRRRIGFDHFIVGMASAPLPSGFTGGCLIWKYSSLGLYSQDNCNGSIIGCLKLIAGNGFERFTCNEEDQHLGNAEHFWGVAVDNNVPPTVYNHLDTPKTHSSYNLPTGIDVNNINDPGSGNISFSVNYLFGPPPNYNMVLYGQSGLQNPVNLSGNVFIQGIAIGIGLNIAAGTTIDMALPLGSRIEIKQANVDAEGTRNSRITFRGAGYDNNPEKYHVPLEEISVTQDVSYSDQNSTIFKYCNFNDVRNNYSCLNIDKKNSNSTLILENINCNYTDSYIKLNGGADIQHRAILSSYSNANPSNLLLSGAWRFDIGYDFYIPQSDSLKINGPAGLNMGTDISFTYQNKINIDGILLLSSNLSINSDIDISGTGYCIIIPSDKDNSPDSMVIKFAANHGITCSGTLLATTVHDDTLSFRTNGDGNWFGIVTVGSPSINISNARFMDAASALKLNDNRGDCNVQYCRFFRNNSTDIILGNYSYFTNTLPVIKNNIYEGNSIKGASIICQSGNSVQISMNHFYDIYNVGLYLAGCTDAQLKSNIFEATLNSGYNPIGILPYSSGGYFSCNDISNFSDGILLDNSSPSLFNNKIYNNGYGLYLTNSSNPVMAPSYGQGQTLIDAGFNQIHDNLNSEIFCDNLLTPLSLPYLYYGSNSIYDNNGGYLIETNYFGGILDAENNYWGGVPIGRFYPDGSVIYDPILPDPPGEPACDPTFMYANNNNIPGDILQLGSANIDFYNGNYSSAVNKYNLYLSSVNSHDKMFLPFAKIFYATSLEHGDFSLLENYFNSLAQQFNNDTIIRYRSNDLSIGSVVNQPEYGEAIDDYSSVINNSTNWYSSHYANIDRMNTIALMLDSLLNGLRDGPLSNNYQNHLNLPISKIQNYLNELINEKPVVTNDKTKINSSKNSSNIDLRNLKDEKKLNLSKSQDNKSGYLNKNLSFMEEVTLNKINSVLSRNAGKTSKNELCSILREVSLYKIIENAMLNYISNERPLTRMKNIRKEGNNIANNIPKKFSLSQNYPNPFNPDTKIKFDIPKKSMVTIKVYDILGKEIAVLVNDTKQPGYFEVEWNASNFASGVYFYRINAGDFNAVKKMVLIK